MQVSAERPHSSDNPKAAAPRGGHFLVILASAVILFSCAAPILISGQDLPPDEQSQLQARRGIRVNRIGAEPTDGRLFVFAPGLYPLEFTSTQDLESADRSMASVLNVLECQIEIEFRPGEKVQLSGRVRTGSYDPTNGFSEKGFHTEISLRSSIEDRSSTIDTSGCKTWIDCDHIDKTRMMPITCN